MSNILKLAEKARSFGPLLSMPETGNFIKAVLGNTALIENLEHLSNDQKGAIRILGTRLLPILERGNGLSVTDMIALATDRNFIEAIQTVKAMFPGEGRERDRQLCYCPACGAFNEI